MKTRLFRALAYGEKTAKQGNNIQLFRLLVLFARKFVRMIVFIVLGNSLVYAKEETHPRPVFKLIKGQGTEVCEAYLERLKKTDYLDNNPTKGRITEPVLKGFVDLKPRPLTAEEIQRIVYKTLSFDRFQDQNLVEKFFYTWDAIQIQHGLPTGRGNAFAAFPPNTLDAINKNIINNQKTPFVRYQTKMDLDNDGIVDDIVIKNNRGVYIVNQQINQIHEENMKRIFADQEALGWLTMYQFPALAYPITVFGYNNKFYFDGFYNNLIFEKGRSVTLNYKHAPYFLGVFIHENQSTHQICDYEWVNGFYETVNFYF